jgi:hypothetical protein
VSKIIFFMHFTHNFSLVTLKVFLHYQIWTKVYVSFCSENMRRVKKSGIVEGNLKYIKKRFGQLFSSNHLLTYILTIGRETAEDLWPVSTLPQASTLQMNCSENSKQIVPEIKLCGLVPKVYIHVSVSDIYISTIGPQTQYSKIGLIFLNILILAVVHSKDDIISFTNFRYCAWTCSCLKWCLKLYHTV